MKIQLPQEVDNIISILESKGYQAYVVGGAIRDLLMKKEPDDWDITTDALPEEIISCFTEQKIVKTGLKHGTVTVLFEGGAYEVTTFRVDGKYSDKRHPDGVYFTPSLREDLSRRDFTINALAYNPSIGLFDYFGGEQDIKDKVVNCVGEPGKRFNEDALRMMRALRFASVLGFEIGQSTASALQDNRLLLNNVAVERLNAELCGLICGKDAANILFKYADIIEVFIPEINKMRGFKQNNPYHYLDVWQHTVETLREAHFDLVLRTALLFHDIGKPECYTEDGERQGHFYGHPELSARIAYRIMKRLKFDNNTIKKVEELILYHDCAILPIDSSLRKWLNKIGEERLRQLISMKEADIKAQSEIYREDRLQRLRAVLLLIDDILAKEQCFSLRDLAVTGSDLIGIGIPQGKQIGKTLDYLLELVIKGEIKNNRNKLLDKAEMFINT